MDMYIYSTYPIYIVHRQHVMSNHVPLMAPLVSAYILKMMFHIGCAGAPITGCCSLWTV